MLKNPMDAPLNFDKTFNLKTNYVTKNVLGIPAVTVHGICFLQVKDLQTE